MDRLPRVVYLDVVGCPENRYDVDQLRAFLVNRGVKITTNPAEADTLIVNTCGLTQMNEKISKEMITKIKEKASPNARLIISGCLPKIHLDALKEFKEAYIIPGPVIESIPWICDKEYNDEADFSPFTFPQRLILEPEKIWNLKKGLLWSFDRYMYRCTGICPPNRVRYYIKIATGCNRHCTYCAIRISRGPLRSRPMEWIIARFKEGISSGYRNINLIGTNVSAYGQDIGTNLPALLREIVSIDGSYRLHLRNLEPEEVLEYLDEFTEVLKSGKIAYLELPLQSGSNRILKLMNRGYTVEEFMECFWALKRAYPKLHIRSQVMVGFPSETEEDFKQTVKIATKLPFIYMEPFRFSPRPGTPAARLNGQLDKKLSKERYHLLRKKLARAHLGSKIRFALTYSLQSMFSSRNKK